MKEKFYLFRDKETDFVGNKKFQAYGIVDSVKSDTPLNSGKDLSVRFIDLFGLGVASQWRSYDEVELFEVDRFKWEDILKFIEDVENIG